MKEFEGWVCALRLTSRHAWTIEETQGSSEPIPEDCGPEEAAPPADSPLSPNEPAQPQRRLEFMKGQFTVPDDIETMFAEEIEEMFYGPEALNKFDRVAKAADERLRQELEAES
jgi:hypothetical protein